MDLNDLSQNIYVLNLEERLDRKEHILKELNKINCVDYILVKSVNGHIINNLTRLKNGMFGLVSTYLKIYEDWKTKKTGTITIIEDDCVFVDNFNEEMSIYMENVPSDWEMIYFGGNHNHHFGTTTQVINPYCLKLSYTFTAHCVILKDHVFEHLILDIKNFTLENDVHLANLQKVYNAYCPVKVLANQIPNFSNIENTNVDYKNIIR